MLRYAIYRNKLIDMVINKIKIESWSMLLKIVLDILADISSYNSNGLHYIWK
jgi:hypothetical protein